MAQPNLENYVPVAERLAHFYSEHPAGRIVTEIVEHDRESGFALMRASAYRNADDAEPAATGYAYETRDAGYVNKTSYVENCETGAIGRALANLGFETKRGAARPVRTPPRPTPPPVNYDTLPPAQLAAQLKGMIETVAGELGYDRAKVDRWVDKTYETEGGLDNCGTETLKTVLMNFYKRLPPTGAVDAALAEWLRQEGIKSTAREAGVGA